MFRLILGTEPEFGFLQGITLVTFFALFIGVLIWALFANKQYINHMRDLPIEDQNSAKGDY